MVADYTLAACHEGLAARSYVGCFGGVTVAWPKQLP